MYKKGDEVFIPCTVLCMGKGKEKGTVMLVSDTDNKIITADICQVYGLEDMKEFVEALEEKKKTPRRAPI